MALAAAQLMTALGLVPAYATPLTAEQIIPAPGLFLHVKNTSGASINVTLDDKSLTPAGSFATDPVHAVPATTGDKMIYLDQRLTDPATGRILVAFSAVTGVTGAVIRVPGIV